MKSQKLLESFTVYCVEHPELQFWQALRAWCGWNFVYLSDEPSNERCMHDTFYWEEKSR